MAESDFQTELGRGFRGLVGCHFHKMHDMPAFLQRKQKERGGVTFKNPYDCFALHHGLYFAMELKQPDGLGLKTRVEGGKGLTPEQEEDLLAVERHGGAGLVVVNFLVALSKREQARRGVETIDRAFSAPVSRIVAARREVAKDSIPLEWWEKNATEIPACKVEAKPAWDPRPMLLAGREWRARTSL